MLPHHNLDRDFLRAMSEGQEFDLDAELNGEAGPADGGLNGVDEATQDQSNGQNDGAEEDGEGEQDEDEEVSDWLRRVQLRLDVFYRTRMKRAAQKKATDQPRCVPSITRVVASLL